MRRFTRRDGLNTVHFFRGVITRQWRWRCFSANGIMISNSGESYHNRADCSAGWHRHKPQPGTFVEHWSPEDD